MPEEINTNKTPQSSIIKQIDSDAAQNFQKEDPTAKQPDPKLRSAAKIVNSEIIDPQKNLKQNVVAAQIKEHNAKLFKNAEELEELCNEYFVSGGSKRKVVVGNGANKRVEEIEVFTLTGLCLHLGFVNRVSLFEMEQHDTYGESIKRAKLRIERIYEENVQTTGNSGNIFALKNFGWVDKQEVSHEIKTLKLDV